jgi:hypothetical protein
MKHSYSGLFLSSGNPQANKINDQPVMVELVIESEPK